MSAPTVDAELVGRICGDTTGIVLDVAADPLDGTVWVRLSDCAATTTALAALNAHGFDAEELAEHRLHVTGFDIRLLHRRLGTLLGGVDDLSAEWDATAELTRYHYDRRVAAGIEPEAWAVLADVETVMRGCVPLPHRAPHSEDVANLLELIDAAEDAYLQLIAEHITYAERVLDEHIAHSLRRDGAA